MVTILINTRREVDLPTININPNETSTKQANTNSSTTTNNNTSSASRSNNRSSTSSTTTTIVRNTLLSDSERVAEASRRLTLEEISDIDRSNRPWVPSFKTSRAGQSLALSILTAAKNEGYALTLEYPHCTSWFDRRYVNWYQPLKLLG